MTSGSCINACSAATSPSVNGRRRSRGVSTIGYAISIGSSAEDRSQELDGARVGELAGSFDIFGPIRLREPVPGPRIAVSGRGRVRGLGGLRRRLLELVVLRPMAQPRGGRVARRGRWIPA